ncbi:hypothetical protein ACH5RR_034056 [Cinchona calisaya]|uniref:RNase H type-1 domain-containing protein n=1 Tax=Cinchona calisaya TaxID=153742 RepID=A0ABD2YAL8_9GENT
MVIWGSVAQLLSKYKEANVIQKATTILGSSCRWERPQPSSIKINFDAAIFSKISSCGIGVMIRNCEEKFITGLAEKVAGISNPELVEMVATRRALELGAEL